MAIEYTITPTETTGRAKVWDASGNGFSLEAVTPAPDFCDLLDSVESELLDAMRNGHGNVKDVATLLISRAKRELLGELLVRLLPILAESTDIALDIECLLSASGSCLRDEPDSVISARLGVLRQTFSARRKALMKKLGMAPPPHAKSASAVETYRKSNRRNYTLND